MGWSRYIDYPKEHNVLEKPVSILTCTGKDYIKANGRKYYYQFLQSSEVGNVWTVPPPILRVTRSSIEYRDYLATVPGTYYLKEYNERDYNIDPTVYPIYIKGEEIYYLTLLNTMRLQTLLKLLQYQM